MIDDDPVEFLQRYKEHRNIEIAGFFASQFAYGKIDVFKKFLRALFECMGDDPHAYIKKGNFSNLKGLYYRFQTSEDIVHLFHILKKILEEYDSIGNALRFFYSGDIRKALWKLRGHLFGKANELAFFFPKPSNTNPLKRWNLYLRWMVRKDGIDVGLWDFIDKRDLIIPLDTHLFKIGRCLGWVEKKTPSWKAACELTGVLKAISPEDPLRYDFFLCHKVGIGAKCTGRKTPQCKQLCILYNDMENKEILNTKPSSLH
ncbi:MAG: TIGR02757 family protein [Proteobacteria bacterium]|nr:TIGR02757 family protein [Pseudomonadota bacterium]